MIILVIKNIYILKHFFLFHKRKELQFGCKNRKKLVFIHFKHEFYFENLTLWDETQKKKKICKKKPLDIEASFQWSVKDMLAQLLTGNSFLKFS